MKKKILSQIGFRKVIYASSKYQITYDVWNSMTTAEKVLCVEYPSKAIIVKGCANQAYEWTEDKFGYNGLGDKSDGYRHGIWNALMTRALNNRYLAELFATAHEMASDEELKKKQADGYTLKAHRLMDMHNNEIGRNVVNWYDTTINLSNNDIKSRVSDKLTGNVKTGIYWLHK